MSANYNAPAASESPLSLQVPVSLRGMRIDQGLAALITSVSRSRIRTWIDAGRVSIDGVAVAARRRLDGGEWIRVEPLADPRAHAYAAEPIALAVVYEDDAIIVIDKPAGLVVHPGSGNWDGTLANALLHHAPELAHVARAGIVHRLDKDTSGLLVVARTDAARTALVRQLQARSVHREYLALALGDIARDGKVDAPIGRHPVRRTSMAVVASGKPAVTHFAVRERFGDCTLLACRLETGRTHQIRVHLASIGHPLVGDRTYARPSDVRFARQALHAHRLGLVHPVTGGAVQWISPLPDDFERLLATLRGRTSSVG